MPIPFIDLASQYSELRYQLDKTLASTIRGGDFTTGKQVELFETEAALHFGVRHCIGVSSGTASLRLALQALGIKSGDEVITSPLSFIATAEAICHSGAKPVFVDINLNDYALNINNIEKAITKKTKAILAVHMYGLSCNMERLITIARKHKLRVIEDCSQAIGTRWNNKLVGTFGDISCFSLYPTKVLGAWGFAGMCLTNSKDVDSEIRSLRDHGRKLVTHLYSKLGYSEVMDDIQAAILRVKLKKLRSWISRRRAVADYYSITLNNMGLTPMPHLPAISPSFYVYVIRNKGRDMLQEKLRNLGIETKVHYPVPLHLQPSLRFLEHRKGDFPLAEKASETVLSLPFHQYLKKKDVDKVCKALSVYN